MTLQYCVKCKTKTQGSNPHTKLTKNGRHMMVSTCQKCGTTKSTFVSKTQGSGVIGQVLGSMLPF